MVGDNFRIPINTAYLHYIPASFHSYQRTYIPTILLTYLLTCSPCSPNNTIIAIIFQFYCLAIIYLPSFVSLFLKWKLVSVIENPKGGRKLLPPPIFIATDVPPPKSKGNQTSLFQIMEAGKKVII